MSSPLRLLHHLGTDFPSESFSFLGGRNDIIVHRWSAAVRPVWRTIWGRRLTQPGGDIVVMVRRGRKFFGTPSWPSSQKRVLKGNTLVSRFQITAFFFTPKNPSIIMLYKCASDFGCWAYLLPAPLSGVVARHRVAFAIYFLFGTQIYQYES